MKIVLLAFLGLVLGALGGAVLGIGAGLAWVEVFKTPSFEGYSGMLVFFTFMPLGAAIGGLGGRARSDQADRRKRPRPPLRPRVDPAGRRYRGLDDALFADCAGFQQADQPAAGAFRPVQGGPAVQPAHPRRHLRAGRAGAG